MSEILVKKLFKEVNLPKYETNGSSGLDLEAFVDSDVILKPGERKLIPTGISIAMPDNFEVQIRPRSGLAYKNGISVVNTPGTIDADYRGEIKVLLINLGQENFVIKKFQRIEKISKVSKTEVASEITNRIISATENKYVRNIS